VVIFSWLNLEWYWFKAVFPNPGHSVPQQ